MERETVRRFYRRMERYPVRAIAFTLLVVLSLIPPVELPRQTFYSLAISLIALLAAFEWGRFVEKRKHLDVTR